MNQTYQLASEMIAKGYTLPADVALSLVKAGYDLNDIENSIDGFDVIDLSDIDYFEYIDQNH